MIRNNYGKTKIKCLLVACVLIASIAMQPTLSNAAKTTSKSNEVVTLSQDSIQSKIVLEPDTTFSVDLNGDGKMDTLQYKCTVDDDAFTADLKLYINGKLCYHRFQENSFMFSVELCDIDTTDNKLDLYIDAKTSSDCIAYSSFMTYDGKSISENEFNPNIVSKQFGISRYSLGDVKGDKTIQFGADTPIYSDAMGCYYCNLLFQLKDNKIIPVKTNTFEFGQYSKDYKYKVIKRFTAYNKPGSKTSAFTVSKGSTVTFDQLYVTNSGKAYVRVINSKGKKAWINAGLKNLFKETPAWG